MLASGILRIADAILDLLVRNAYHLDLSGDLVRKLKSLRAETTKPVSAAALTDQ